MVSLKNVQRQSNWNLLEAKALLRDAESATAETEERERSSKTWKSETLREDAESRKRKHRRS